MASGEAAHPAAAASTRQVRRHPSVIPGFGITLGLTLTWLALIVLIPLGGLLLKTTELSLDQFWSVVTSRRAFNALQISFGLSLAAAAINLVFGTLIVWALVRYEFPFKRMFDAIIDIPFALPTAVAGIALTTLFAENGCSAGFSCCSVSRSHSRRLASSLR